MPKEKEKAAPEQNSVPEDAKAKKDEALNIESPHKVQEIKYSERFKEEGLIKGAAHSITDNNTTRLLKGAFGNLNPKDAVAFAYENVNHPTMKVARVAVKVVGAFYPPVKIVDKALGAVSAVKNAEEIGKKGVDKAVEKAYYEKYEQDVKNGAPKKTKEEQKKEIEILQAETRTKIEKSKLSIGDGISKTSFAPSPAGGIHYDNKTGEYQGASLGFTMAGKEHTLKTGETKAVADEKTAKGFESNARAEIAGTYGLTEAKEAEYKNQNLFSNSETSKGASRKGIDVASDNYFSADTNYSFSNDNLRLDYYGHENNSVPNNLESPLQENADRQLPSHEDLSL